MPRRNQPPRERIARALCRLDGHAENITMDGDPMWRSYDDEAIEVLAALQVTPLLEVLAEIAADEATPPACRERARAAVVAFNGDA